MFFADGEPVAQPRARACIRGRHAGVYDPGTADAWKRTVAIRAKEAWDGVQFTGPLKLTINAYFPRPKSHFGKRGLKDGAPRFHTIRPDVDNLAKAIMDALTKAGIWSDDCQVVEGKTSKWYTALQVGAQIEIEELK
ncbi:MAG: RusA family crossover junction endodeoxyribonuclease [Caulobacteraceae bacterium]|nr:RusA family crossover junction endodeoxyribonuclease [Caulobacteraceae bacterium]